MSLTRILSAGICLLGMAFPTAPARAAGSLNDALTAVADDVKKFLDGRGESAVTVGQFRGTGAFAVNASAGPNLVRALSRELQARTVDVRLKSNVTVLGNFEEAEDKDSQLQVVLLRVELRERKTGKKTELEHRFVKNQAALAVLLGLTVKFPAGAGPKERNRAIKKQLDKPRTHLADSRIRAAAGSPFALEVLVAPPDPDRDGKRTEKDYKARAAEDREQSGLAFVKIARGEV